VSNSDLHVTWAQYHHLIERLAVQVHESAWRFDAIVCLARGGLRVGDVLSRLFELPLGVLFTSSYREAAGTEQSALHIADALSSANPLPGPRWLLVDDMVDSGATFAQVLPVLKARHPHVSEIRSAVLWSKGQSVIKPDYVVEDLPHNPWIHQPFERYDTMRFEDLKLGWADR
jgi:uncharacterized protein